MYETVCAQLEQERRDRAEKTGQREASMSNLVEEQKTSIFNLFEKRIHFQTEFEQIL